MQISLIRLITSEVLSESVYCSFFVYTEKFTFTCTMKLSTALSILLGCLVACSVIYQIEASKKKYALALLAGAALGKKYATVFHCVIEAAN